MKLPPDFDNTLDQVFRFNIPEESVGDIAQRQAGSWRAFDRSNVMGPKDALASLENFKIAVRNVLCDPNGQGVRPEFVVILKTPIGSAAVRQLASIICSSLVLRLDASGLSSVLIYVSLELLKTGVDDWCRLRM